MDKDIFNKMIAEGPKTPSPEDLQAIKEWMEEQERLGLENWDEWIENWDE